VEYSLSKVSKRLKKLPKKLKTPVPFFRRLLEFFSKKISISSPLFFLTLGIFLLIFGGVNYYRVRVLSFTKSPVVAPIEQKGELPVRVAIPSVGIDLAVDVGEIKDGVWKISYNNATFLDGSGRPGGGNNVVIYGHNKKAIFGNLPFLSLGQKIYVKTADGKLHKYEAYQKDFVGSNRVDLVSPTNKEELTIYTCWGLFDSQRVVIKAKPVL
jgi:LPXTG-site transpeptidase (sortase) family protein